MNRSWRVRRVSRVENLLEVLRSNGFYLAQGNAGNHAGARAASRPQFQCRYGKRAKYSAPIVKGTPNKSTEDIIDATRWKRLFGLLGWKEVTETRTQQGIDRIRKAYQKKEYLMAR